MAQPNQAGQSLPPDHEQRQLIVTELDTTLLVEAAAGTGKTTCMINRMVALLREGKCRIDTMAAVTFTRKAAAELRARFQVALERETRAAEGAARQRLKSALDSIDRCFTGTIHSFCARLLRERPVEAGVDLAFQELDEQVDDRFRQQAWDYYVAALFARDDPILRELDELGVTGLLTKAETILEELNDLGLDVSQLVDMFKQFASFPDVEEWPAEKVNFPDLAPVLIQVEEYLQHMAALAPTFPEARGNDELMNTYERLPRLFRQVNRQRVAEVMNFLARFRKVNVVQKEWSGGKQQGKNERDRWVNFATGAVEPLVNIWLEKRYEAIIRAIRPAIEVYDRLRQQAGGLNFQDLLLRAAFLLRDKPAIRSYFRSRFTHILVDEFQDTDPIQAEVMLFLTADDPGQTHWRQCRPVPGSLFLVGDPKQSIYRFRRADIVTYEQVKEIVIQYNGKVVALTANFRSRPELVNWCNATFQNVFPTTANKYQPAACPMLVGRTDQTDGQLAGIKIVRVPAQFQSKDQAVEFEADFTARSIRHWLDAGLTIARSTKEIEQGMTPQATPGDFLIVTWFKKNLALIAQKFQELDIPHQVTGSSALGRLREATLLSGCLAALIDPDNPVALVAILRGELFGISDPDLYAFKRAGGRFDYRSEIPDNLAPTIADPIRNAFARFRRYATWLRRLPPVPAFERVAADLGLAMRALGSAGGNERAGCLAKIFETLRSAQSQLHSAADLAELLKNLIDTNSEFDGLPARPHDTAAVRLMNLHKAKGLEAPVVFLAGAVGQFDHPVGLHVDRSGDKVRGYAAIHGTPKDWGRGPLLARPRNWDQLAAEEDQFLDGEERRLFYVAATRAGTELVIVQRDAGNQHNPWQFFGQYLQGKEALPDPGPQQPCAGSVIKVAPASVADGIAAVTRRWQITRTPGYSQAAAKAISVKSFKRTEMVSSGEHGTEWGSVIHLLLQTAMGRPESILHDLAYVALAEVGLEVSLAELAVDTVKSVMSSAIWKRAQASQQRMVEVPFEMLMPTTPPEKPTLLRGCIDLVFLEPAGWVIVDYKTDPVSFQGIATLAQHYQGQLEIYAESWKRMVGPVHERGLYFTSVAQYVQV